MGNSVYKRLIDIEENVIYPLKTGYTELQFKGLVDSIFIKKYIPIYEGYDYIPYVYDALDGILEHECLEIGVITKFTTDIETPLNISDNLPQTVKICQEKEITTILLVTNAVSVSNYTIDYFSMNHIKCIPLCRDIFTNSSNKLCYIL